MNIRIATTLDFDYLIENDKHIGEKELIKKIDDQQIYILSKDKTNCGWLRYGLFWDNTPFMNVIYMNPSLRNQGYGGSLILFWEKQMKNQGYKMVMTSSLSNEKAQHVYRKLGYKDAGCLLLDGEALEIIFTKSI